MRHVNFKLVLALIFCLSFANGWEAEAAKPKKQKKVKNVILMVGDGMGVSQIYAGLTAKKDALNLERCRHIGFSKTNSSDNYITDSAAGATAWSIGEKTYNGAIGVDNTRTPKPTILEIASKNGKSTGLVSMCSITHATPASFAAHQPSRKLDEAIASDIAQSPVDVFFGGGLKYFNQRTDNMNLLPMMEKRGFQVAQDFASAEKLTKGKVAGFLAANHPPKMSEGRGDLLQKTAKKAIDLLSQNKDGFFLMIEGSQIDWGGHANDSDYIVQEMVDFDNAIGDVLDFAEKDGNTLVIITADHETGGYAITGGSFETGTVTGKFVTDYHTGVMVPVFAFGPGAEEFMGIYHNHTIFEKMMNAFQFKK